MQSNLELSKTRDFGEIISDSFLFIRQNLKPLLSCFFVLCGFFLLATAVATIAQQAKLVDAFGNNDYAVSGPLDWTAYSVETIIAVIFMVVTYIAMPLTVLCFMALYKEKGNVSPNVQEVWAYFKYYFLRTLGGSILNGVMLIVGFVLCVIPGIYLYPILSLVIPIMIMENAAFGYAFNKSFVLIKQNWWMVFGALFVTGLIISICSAVITLPFQAVSIWSVFIHRVQNVHLTLAAILIGTILRQLVLVLYILPLVTLGICYFSLSEDKDATGLLGRINQLGNNTAENNAPAEEY